MHDNALELKVITPPLLALADEDSEREREGK